MRFQGFTILPPFHEDEGVRVGDAGVKALLSFPVVFNVAITKIIESSLIPFGNGSLSETGKISQSAR